MRLLPRVCLGLAVFGLLTPLAHDSRAGIQDPQYAGCSNYSSGGGCSGPMAGFKNSSDSNAWVEFYQSAGAGGISRFFSAELNGTSYYCDASSAANIGATWPGYANMQNVQFYISWDSNNTWRISISTTIAVLLTHGDGRGESIRHRCAGGDRPLRGAARRARPA